MVDSHSSGKTVPDSWYADIYTVDPSSIASYDNWITTPELSLYEDFPTKLAEIGAPYAKYCTSYENFSIDMYYQPLCEIKHKTDDNRTPETHNLQIVCSVTNQ